MRKSVFLVTLLSLISLGIYAQESCTPLDHPSNAIRSKAFMDAGGQTVANDFHLSANTLNFSVEQIEANLWTEEGDIASLDLVFYNNSSDNHPGTIVGDTIFNIIPTSQVILDDEDGFDIRRVVISLPTPLELEGSGIAPVKYWVQLIAHASLPGKRVGWELNGVEVSNEGVNYSNPNINHWLVNETWDGVFTINGECTLIEGCLIPDNVTATSIGINEATIEWIGDAAAVSYLLEYGPAGFVPATGQGIELPVSAGTTTVVLTDLEMVTTYDVYTKTICEDGESIFTIPLTFSTIDEYCSIGNLDTIEPISFVEFAGIENRSPAGLNDAPAHEYFLNQIAEVIPGETYTITVEGNTGGNYSDGVTVFFDWNQDGEFNNTTERYDIGILENSSGEDGVQISAQIEVPQNALSGNTRMRLAKEFYANAYPTDGCYWISYGQAEDYGVTVGVLSTNEVDTVSFSVYPNPVSDNLNIKSDKIISSMEIYNLIGHKVYDNTLGASEAQLDVSHLSSGVYLVKIISEKSSETLKIIKK